VSVLVVDGANVVGSRPDGWWRDRPGAARRLYDALAAADLAHHEVVLVLEGAARRGVEAGTSGGVLVVHAPGSGDDAIVATVAERTGTAQVVVVTADRGLRARVEQAGASCQGSRWLLDRL
jgi:predicted RNA-binding protein with PIN domain